MARLALVRRIDRCRSASLSPVPAANVRARRLSLSRPTSVPRSVAAAAERALVGSRRRGRASTEGDSRMNAITMTVPQTRTTAARRAPVHSRSLLGFVASLQISIVAGPDSSGRHARVAGSCCTSRTITPIRAAVLRAAAGVRCADARRVRVFARSRRELHGQQAARAVRDRAGRVRHRARSPRLHRGRRHHLGRRRSRHHRRAAVRACCTTTTSVSVRRARSATT